MKKNWKEQWKKIEKENKDFLRYVFNFIKRGYGKKCEEVAERCPTCQMYAVYDILKSHFSNRLHKCIKCGTKRK